MTDREKQIRTFVELGFSDVINDDYEFRSSDFLTDELTTEEAKSAISLVEEHNDFKGKKIAKQIGQFKNRVSSWRFGRANSPVIFIGVPAWTHQTEDAIPGSQGRCLTTEERETLITDLKKVFIGKLAADEFDVIGEHKLEVRVWWG